MRGPARQEFQIAPTFLFFELSESTTPFWNQQDEARRKVFDLVWSLIGFSGWARFPMVRTIGNWWNPENCKIDRDRQHSTRLALLISKWSPGFCELKKQKSSSDVEFSRAGLAYWPDLIGGISLYSQTCLKVLCIAHLKKTGVREVWGRTDRVG